MSSFFRPHGLKPARLLCPWGFSGKNTGMGCHALLQGILPTQGSNPGLLHCRCIFNQLSHQGSPFQNTGMGSLSLFQGTFPTLESNWGLLHCRQILYQLSYQKPRSPVEISEDQSHNRETGSQASLIQGPGPLRPTQAPSLTACSSLSWKSRGRRQRLRGTVSSSTKGKASEAAVDLTTQSSAMQPS